MKLTKTAIESITANGKDQYIWDSELPGFGVRCNTSGRKTYILRYRNNEGQHGKRTIARVCDMAPDQARALARKFISRVREGEDLQGRRGTLTVAQLWDMYLLRHAKPYKKPSSIERDQGLWLDYICPKIGSKPIRSVTRADVVALHVAMCNVPTSANRAVALLSKMFNLASEWEVLEAGYNPARRIKKYPERTRERILTEAEISRIIPHLKDEHPHFARLVRLLMLTGCRFSEIGKARSEWVDLERGLLVLPDSKTGQRSVRLPNAALELLQDVHKREFLCPGIWVHKGAAYAAHAWRRVCRKAGVRGANFHTIRHTVGSFAHKAGMSQREIADLLGHRQLSTTARYIHSVKPADVDRVNKAMGL
jgi:integrase